MLYIANSRPINGDGGVKTAGWPDIGYNYLLGEDGNAYEGRGWDYIGSQVREYNAVSLGFSVIGDFSKRLPNKPALDVVKQLIACALHKVCTYSCSEICFMTSLQNIPNYQFAYDRQTGAKDLRPHFHYCNCLQGKSAKKYTLHGHRDGGSTDCPGQKLYDHIKKWPHYGGKLPHKSTTAEPARNLSLQLGFMIRRQALLSDSV